MIFAIGLLPPADITLQTSLLWTNIRIELLICCLAIDAKALRLFAIGIVLYRTAAIEHTMIHLIRQLHDNTITEHIRNLGTCCRLEIHGNVHASILIQAIVHRQCCLYLRKVIYRLYRNMTVFLILFAIQRDKLHLRIPPYVP